MRFHYQERRKSHGWETNKLCHSQLPTLLLKFAPNSSSWKKAQENKKILIFTDHFIGNLNFRRDQLGKKSEMRFQHLPFKYAKNEANSNDPYY